MDTQMPLKAAEQHLGGEGEEDHSVHASACAPAHVREGVRARICAHATGPHGPEPAQALA